MGERAIEAPVGGSAEPTAAERNLREILMGAQDNLTNVLAIVLGVALGSGEVRTVALAGMAAGLAEAISMGGVLYTSTTAERDLARRAGSSAGVIGRSSAAKAGVVTFLAAVVAAVVPLIPFVVLDLEHGMLASAIVSVGALFALGAWKGHVTGRPWWRDGLQVVGIGATAALAAAAIGGLFRAGGV